MIRKLVSPRRIALIKSIMYSFPERLKSLDLNNIIITTNGKYLFELRRATHRLEKSLTFKVRKPGGGTNISQEILDLLTLNAKRNFADEFTLKWTLSVLQQQVIQLKNDLATFKEIKTEAIKETIDKIEPHLKNQNPQTSIKESKDEPAPQLSSEDLLHFFKSRHSVRSFKSIVVEHDAISKAIEIAKLTPTPCNKQAVKVSIVQNRKDIFNVLKLQGGIVGNEDQIFNIAVISSTREAYPGFNEKHSVYTEGALFGMNFIWGLHTQKISTVILNWVSSSKKTRNLNKILSLNKHYIPVFIVAFGYCQENIRIPGSPRQDTQSFLNIID